MSSYDHPVNISTEFGSIETGWNNKPAEDDPLKLGYFAQLVTGMVMQAVGAQQRGASTANINNYIRQITYTCKAQITDNKMNHRAYVKYLNNKKEQN